jgi:hypothetical protein
MSCGYRDVVTCGPRAASDESCMLIRVSRLEGAAFRFGSFSRPVDVIRGSE